jgi:hypothetical protein
MSVKRKVTTPDGNTLVAFAFPTVGSVPQGT